MEFLLQKSLKWYILVWCGCKMIDIVRTTKNKKYKYIKSLQQKKMRVLEGVFTVEGKKSVIQAIDSMRRIKLIAVSESFLNENDCGFLKNIDYLVVSDDIFAGLCDTKTPQGIIAVIQIDNNDEFLPDINKLYVYCDNVSDPGNLGTIIRTADAAGFGGVLLSKGCADAYSPKTVRASMGSFFNIDIITEVSYETLFDMKNDGFSLACGALCQDSKCYTDVDFKKPMVIVVGNEANGVSDGILKECEHIIIPIYGKAESLNVGVAAAVMMYEAVRQREVHSNEQ